MTPNIATTPVTSATIAVTITAVDDRLRRDGRPAIDIEATAAGAPFTSSIGFASLAALGPFARGAAIMLPEPSARVRAGSLPGDISVAGVFVDGVSEPTSCVSAALDIGALAVASGR